MSDDPQTPEGKNKSWALELTALCLSCDVSTTSKLAFISPAVFLNAISLAHLTLLIWGYLGEQIIQLHLPDDTDKHLPRQCPQIKIPPAGSQVCGEKGQEAGGTVVSGAFSLPCWPLGCWLCWLRGSVAQVTCDVLTAREGWRGLEGSPFPCHWLCPPQKALVLGKHPRRVQRALRRLGQVTWPC